MNIYERMKHDLILKIATALPELNKDSLCSIAQAMDEVSTRYTISEAEVHLAVLGQEEFQKVIKTYVVTKYMEGLSEDTIRNYILRLRALMISVAKPLDKVTANDVRLFLFNYQEQRGITNRTLESMRVVICSFFRWAASEGYIPANPTETLKPIKYSVTPRGSLEQIELERIRMSCLTKRETAIIEVLYSTGCRVSELTTIKLSDIDWNKHSVTLFGKGKKFRTSYINAKAEVALQAYLSTRVHQCEYLFNNDRGGGQMNKRNVERIIRKIKNRAGFIDRKITPHTFRHTTATQALRSGMPVNDIQILLGHVNLATTMIYAHTTNEAVASGHRRCIV